MSLEMGKNRILIEQLRVCNWAEEWVAPELKEPPLEIFPFPSLKDTGSLCGCVVRVMYL